MQFFYKLTFESTKFQKLTTKSIDQQQKQQQHNHHPHHP